MQAVGINHTGTVLISENMSGLEENPKDDWLYLALLSLAKIAKERGDITSAAMIGCGNGIDAIAVLKLFPNLQRLIVTDVIEDIMPHIEANIENSVPDHSDVSITYTVGPDAYPLEEKVDLIYANLPLVMVDEIELQENRSTTTLTDAKRYIELAQGDADELKKYSLLSQLGFLLSAKERITKGGTIITLIGGRVPFSTIDECFKRAGLQYKHLYTAFMKQSDAEFTEQYANLENDENVEFVFYDYDKAKKILQDEFNVIAPDVIPGVSESSFKEALESAQINANQAFNLFKQGRDVGHLAFAFEASII